MQKKRSYYNPLLRLIFQTLLYVSLFFIFFGLLSIGNPQLLKLSRTSVTTMGVYVVCFSVMLAIYGGLEVGRKTRRSVFFSLVLSIFFTDAVTYLFLQVMNVNPNNPEANPTLILFGEDFLYLCIAFVLQVLLTMALILLSYRIYYKKNPPKRCLLVTSSQELAAQVAHKLSSFRQRYQLSEVVHYQCPDLKETIERYQTIFLAGIPGTEQVQLQAYCYGLEKSIYLMAELETVITSCAESTVLDDMPFLHIRPTGMTPMQRVVKRGLDIFISGLGLIVTSPILLITAILIKCCDGDSVFFRQKRATIRGEVFEIIKFRTMYSGNRQADSLSARVNDDRITPVGRYLRKYRIDELPQLINVLKGEMSIVGPRPEMLENVQRYTEEVPEFRYRQRMKAGITGLAQIEGKYNTSPKDKAMLDLFYIENFSLSYDFKLMLRTLTVFFRRDSTEGFGQQNAASIKMRTEALTGSPMESPDAKNISNRRKKHYKKQQAHTAG